MNTTQESAKKKNRKSMLLVFALFAVPVLIAWFLLGPGRNWLPSGATNNGTLVAPARPLPTEGRLAGLNGTPLTQGYLTEKWTLVHFVTKNCDQTCKELLHRTKQVRLAMGEDIRRIQRLLIFTEQGLDVTDSVMADDPNLAIALVTYASNPELLNKFVIGGVQPETGNRVYLVDPLGNLMMYYESTDRPNGILIDLRKLLKWSQIG